MKHRNYIRIMEMIEEAVNAARVEVEAATVGLIQLDAGAGAAQRNAAVRRLENAQQNYTRMSNSRNILIGATTGGKMLVPKELNFKLVAEKFETTLLKFEKILSTHRIDVNVQYRRLLPLILHEDDNRWFGEMDNENVTWDEMKDALRGRIVGEPRRLRNLQELLSTKCGDNEAIEAYCRRYRSLMLEARREEIEPELFLLTLPATLQSAIHHLRLARADDEAGIPAFANVSAAMTVAVECSRYEAKSQQKPQSQPQLKAEQKKKKKQYCENHGWCAHTTASCRSGRKAPTDATPQRNFERDRHSTVICFRCNQRGHYANKCHLQAASSSSSSSPSSSSSASSSNAARFNQNRTELNQMEVTQQSADFDEWEAARRLFVIGSELDTAAKAIRMPVVINKSMKMRALVDTGASASFMSDSLARKIPGWQPSSHESNVKMAITGSVIKPLGVVEVTISCEGRNNINHEFVVLQNLRDDVILGIDLLPLLGIQITGLSTSFPDFKRPNAKVDDDWMPEVSRRLKTPHDQQEEIESAVQDLLEQNASIPDTAYLDPAYGTIRLETKGSPQAKRQYPIPDRWMSYVDAQVEEWARDERIEKGNPRSLWQTPLMAAPKRKSDGTLDKVRVCLDPRHTNPLLVVDPKPIPRISDIIRRLKGSVIISRLDLKGSFNQILLEEKYRDVTTFKHRNEFYRFRTGQWGFATMTAQFQRIMESLFHHFPFVLIYVDDLIIFSGDVAEHIDHLRRVLTLLNSVFLRLSRAKCDFGFVELDILGHVVSGSTTRADPLKCEAIVNLPRPSTGKQVQALLGMVNFLRNYIPLYSRLLWPFEKLRSVTSIVWNPKLEDAFLRLKTALINAPILHHAHPTAELSIATDASLHGVGAVLYQTIDNERVYLQFAAKSLNAAQVNYPAGKRELLAIIFALRSFHQLIAGVPFTLYTDHRALTYILTKPQPPAMLAYWAETILQYNFSIVHRPGAAMVLPDALSRLFPAPMTTKWEENELNNITATLKNFVKERLSKRVPKDEEERQQLLDSLHREGHFAVESTFRKLFDGEGVYWPSMRQDIQAFIKRCDSCQRANIVTHGYHPLHTIVETIPFQTVAADLFGPMDTTSNGNNYVLLVVDIASRFVMLKSIQSKTKEDTARALLDTFYTYGFPATIRSDLGSEFHNTMVGAITHLCEMKHRKTMAYDPNSNGAAEAHVKIARNILRKLMIENAEAEWDELLSAVQFYSNTRVASRHKSQPFAVFYGRTAAFLPSTTAASSADGSSFSPEEAEARIQQMQEVVWPAARAITNAHAEKMQQTADGRRPQQTFNIGDSVMISMPPRSKKSGPRYTGPFTVAQRSGNGYKLMSSTGLLPRAIPTHRLKLVQAAEEIEEHEVEHIISHRKTLDGSIEFLTKWIGHEDPTWEPEHNFISEHASTQAYTSYWEENSRKDHS